MVQVQLQNVTEDQIASFPAGESMSSKDVMQFQTCAIAWSSSFSEAASHLPATTNSSLLALGNRSGGVGFFYWDPSINKARQCLTCHLTDAWVTNFAWSKWKTTTTANSGQNAQAHLACGLSDGSVHILLIQHNPDSEELYSVFKLPIAIEADSRSITAMALADIGPDRQLLLAAAKPGFVHLYTQSGSSDNRIPEAVSRQTVPLYAFSTSLPRSTIQRT
ncbi:hypothetical protein FRC09_007082 [Ceratobasidium sp. 395]|nr:hypothetical protein FRC09_007082 [Ceratobasidium sp. 395]